MFINIKIGFYVTNVNSLEVIGKVIDLIKDIVFAILFQVKLPFYERCKNKMRAYFRGRLFKNP